MITIIHAYYFFSWIGAPTTPYTMVGREPITLMDHGGGLPYHDLAYNLLFHEAFNHTNFLLSQNSESK